MVSSPCHKATTLQVHPRTRNLSPHSWQYPTTSGKLILSDLVRWERAGLFARTRGAPDTKLER